MKQNILMLALFVFSLTLVSTPAAAVPQGGTPPVQMSDQVTSTGERTMTDSNGGNHTWAEEDTDGDGKVDKIQVDGQTYCWSSGAYRVLGGPPYNFEYYTFDKQPDGSYTYEKKVTQVGTEPVIETGTLT